MTDNPLDAMLSSDDSAENMARLLETAAANGLNAQMHGVSHETASRATTLAVLAALAGNRARQEDSLKFEGTSFIIPESYRGDIPKAVTFLQEFEANQAAKVNLVHTFDYRPFDVAHAAQEVMKDIFGYTGSGITIKKMFGDIEPAMIDLAVGIDQKVQVPWNRVAFSPFSGHIDIDSEFKNGKGLIGKLTVKAPRGLRDVVEGFFVAVEEKLKTGSIYRGKAILLSENDDVEFLDLSKVKREDVVYGDEVMAHLEANLWVVLRNMQAMRDAGQPIKRAVLLEGPFGTGKSLTGFLTAQEAVANGITFIFAKPGADLTEALQTAQLYAPAVVFFEDIDVLQTNDPEQVSKLLDAFDGVGGKGKEVIAVLTTNNREKIHKGMLRPGRLDAVIHIAELDEGGVRRLIEATFRRSSVQLVDVKWAEVYEANQEYMPAFVREGASRAFRYAMVRANGIPKELTTDDLVMAARSLEEQHKLMTGAYEIQPPSTLAMALHNSMVDAMESVSPVDINGEPSHFVNRFVGARK
jgi:hypothetical protein